MGYSFQEGQVIFITGDTIARLLQNFPGLVCRFLGWEMLVRWHRGVVKFFFYSHWRRDELGFLDSEKSSQRCYLL